MIKKKNLDLFEESYNEGYETGVMDLFKIISDNTKTKKQKEIYIGYAEKLLNKKIKKES
jgi:hypothetical protein